MPVIKSIYNRKILNSHVKFTPEFIIEFDDGISGTGASPQGETISIYEDRKVSIDPATVIKAIYTDGYIGKMLSQENFDNYLHEHMAFFGRNNSFGLSLAFFNGLRASKPLFERYGLKERKMFAPYICFNILNGGWHAYTNPVLSDFSEFMLVPKSNNLSEVIEYHNEIQNVIKEKLTRQEKTIISGNPVNCFPTRDNRECIDFLLGICNNLGLSNQFDLMIDASAGDLWADDGYKLAITDNSSFDREKFCGYWMDLIRQYNLRFLEDPFHEKDFSNWHNLTQSQQDCYVIGDNLYSSDSVRIEEGSKNHYSHGVVVKPNQAGSVTAVCRAIETAQLNNQIVITSHRSISTESTFLSELTCVYNVKYIKVGPLVTDYSSVVRFNEFFRLTEELKCQ